MNSNANAIIDGKFRIETALGSGGFGTVYKAWQLELDRFVALKLLRESALQDSDGLLRFEREAKALNSIRHKNIVAFYGFGALKDSYYIAMELVDGASLDKIIAQGRIKPEQAVNIACQMLDALGAAHASGVVHRDLKPSNILFAGGNLNNPVKLIDFGLVKLMPGYGLKSQSLTEAGMALGTAKYMSPEQCTGNEEVDPRSDLYGVGCILFEMLTGYAPFDADEGITMMVQHVNAQPPNLSEFFASSPCVRDLNSIIQRALEKRPDARYQTAQEFRESLLSLNTNQIQKLKSTTPAMHRQLNLSSGRIEKRKKLSSSSAATTSGASSSGRGRILISVCALAVVSLAALALLWKRSEVPAPVDSEIREGEGDRGRSERAVKRISRTSDLIILTLKELQENRASLSSVPEPETRLHFYRLLAAKERDTLQYADSIKDYRAANSIDHELGLAGEELNGCLNLTQCGYAGHIPLEQWLPDLEGGIAIAKQIKSPQIGGRLNLTAAQAVLNHSDTASDEQLKKWLESALEDERDTLKIGEKFLVFTRGEPELCLAQYFRRHNQPDKVRKYLEKGINEMTLASPDERSLLPDQLVAVCQMIQENAKELPAKTLTDMLAILNASNPADPAYISVNKNIAKAHLQAVLKQPDEAAKSLEKAVQEAHEKSAPILQAFALHTKIVLVPMSPAEQVAVAKEALRLCQSERPVEPRSIASSFAVLADCDMRVKDYNSAVANFKESANILYCPSSASQYKFERIQAAYKMLVAGAWAARLNNDARTRDTLTKQADELLKHSEQAKPDDFESSELKKLRAELERLQQGQRPDVGFGW